MENYIKRNLSPLITIFLLLQPILDLLTGICIHFFQINITIGIIFRMIFLLCICLIALFIYKKKKLVIPYSIIGLYCILYLIGIVMIKNNIGLFKEIQNLVKTIYFPILLITLYSLKEEVRINSLTLLIALYTYIFLIFIPLLFGIGYKTYAITKDGTLGFFHSANEISGIISILTPIALVALYNTKKYLLKVIIAIIYIIVILSMGTKTPLLTLCLVVGFGMMYYWLDSIFKKKYKQVVISFIVLIVGVGSLLVFLPKTNFYKNIETHLNFLGLHNISDVLKDEKAIDHFIFSQRLTFLHNKALIYKEANPYQKLFGIGYMKKDKEIKAIEMDYFDIYYSHGLIGFLIFFSITLYVLYKTFEEGQKLSYKRYMYIVSFFLVILLSFFTGHIITSPSVSIFVIIIITSISKKQYQTVLVTDSNKEISTIKEIQEDYIKQLENLQYKITKIQIDEENNSFLNKIWLQILNNHNYDYSLCLTSYNTNCNELTLSASDHPLLFMDHDYKGLIKKETEFKDYFKSIGIMKYKKIIFISKERKDKFVKVFKEFKNQSIIFNNKKVKMINIETID